MTPPDRPRRSSSAPPKKKQKKKTAKKKSPPALVVGWREWVALPDLGVARIKVKMDTGARSSAIHAWDIHRFKRRGVSMVRFTLHPVQRDARTVVPAEAPLLEMRKVRSSSGVQSLRPTIVTTLALGGAAWPIELTLVRRDAMGFRMLLGRQALRGHAVVDPGRSFVAPSSPAPRPPSTPGESQP